MGKLKHFGRLVVRKKKGGEVKGENIIKIIKTKIFLYFSNNSYTNNQFPFPFQNTMVSPILK